MHHLRTLIAIAGLAAFGYASAQNVPCPGETLTFQLEGEYYGTKTWEHSVDGVVWNAVEVVENEPFVLQPEQSGWYRVRFHDEACDVSYFSDPQRFVAHSIDLGGTVTISVGGVVRNEGGGPIVGAIVRAGCGAGVSTTTDRFGVFKLNGVEVHEGLATLTVEKEGYFTGSRSFVPSDSSGHALSYAYVTLLSEIDRGTVNGVLGGTINGLGGVVFTFPPNSFVQNGSPYMGNVIVRNNYVRPTDPEMHMKMPGLLLGVDEGGAQVLQSYGMSVTELVDDNGQAVQLAPDVLVGMRIPFPSSLSSTAPPVIPLWYYDEDLGYWIQEGEAMLVLGSYVGQVSHFSWWNIDVPSDFVMLDGVVVDSGLDSVLQGARVILNSTTIGTAIAYTDASGAFSGFVPLGQELAIQVQMQCGENGEWVTVHGETIGPFQVASSVVLASTSPSHFVGGVVVDCDQIAVEEGYVLANGVVHFCESGTFSVYACLAYINA